MPGAKRKSSVAVLQADATVHDSHKEPNSRVFGTHRLDGARTVREFMPAGGAEAALADAGKADQIQWARFRSRSIRSPIKAADDVMCGKYAQQWASRPYCERQRTLQRWFVRYYTANAAQRLMDTFVADKESLDKLKDAPRYNPEPARKLSNDQQAACHRWLTVESWQDDCDPPRNRRYSGLGDAYTKLSDTPAVTAAVLIDKAELEDIYLSSKARTWHKLTQSVMRVFDLRWFKERPHEERTHIQHQVHADRWLSKRPVLEYMRSTEANPQSVHTCVLS